MALEVETGACVAAADSFIERAYLIAYAADYYPAISVPDDDSTDAAIRRGCAWVSSFPDWDGSPTCGRGLQGLAWPRQNVSDCNGDVIPSDEVPIEVLHASCLASLAELASPGVLGPTIIPGAQQKRAKVDVIEVEYMTPVDQGLSGKDPAKMLRPVLTTVSDLLRCIASMPNGFNTPWPWVA